MKIRLVAFASIVMLLTVTLSLSSCRKDILGELGDLFNQSDPSLHVDLQHAGVHIEDANKMPATGDKTKLWNNRGHVPIMAPDGHQPTLGEFNKASGRADIKCTSKGTHVNITLHGLIPNENYSIWVLTFKAPGFEDGGFTNLIGMGALGPKDGSQSAFKANASGNASLTAVVPKDSLSLFGSVGKCLSSEFEVHLVGAYHLDNQTHGSNPGEPNTWVAQFAFQFKGGF